MEVCLRLMFLTFRCRLGLESLRRELTTSVAAAGLIDAHHPYGGSDAASGHLDLSDERGVDDGPIGAVLCRGLGHASLMFGNRPAQLSAQLGHQSRARPDCGHRLGERGPGTRAFQAAPLPLLPEQPQSRCPIRDFALS